MTASGHSPTQKLDRSTLWSLEDYAARREAFRKEVIAHKKSRRVALNAHATLYFEDHMTMKYQVQEMLRIERLFEPEEIADELGAYNPLIPDGSNWKATFMIEYEDVAERRAALARLRGVENTLWVRIGDHDKVYAIANEDLERSSEDKTSAVHFVRFELSPDMIQSARDGAPIAFGLDHDAMRCALENVGTDTRRSLIADLTAH
jgi:hypothetical protein